MPTLDPAKILKAHKVLKDPDKIRLEDTSDAGAMSALIKEFESQREANEKAAKDHAKEVTGYEWSMLTMLTDDAEATKLIEKLEFERLESAAKEQRLRAVIELLK